MKTDSIGRWLIQPFSISFLLGFWGGVLETYTIVSSNPLFFRPTYNIIHLGMFSSAVYTLILLGPLSVAFLLISFRGNVLRRFVTWSVIIGFVVLFSVALVQKGQGISLTGFQVFPFMGFSATFMVAVVVSRLLAGWVEQYVNREIIVGVGGGLVVTFLIVSFSVQPALNEGTGETVSTPSGDRPNIIFLGIDTLRADHLNQHGYDILTPTIDQLARQSVVFDRAITPSGWTRASFTSMFTARTPHYTGVLNNGFQVTEELVTLAEVLRQNGYNTAGFISLYVLNSTSGFPQGFSYFNQKLYPNFLPSFSSAQLIPFKLLDNVGLVRADIKMRDAVDVNQSLSGWLNNRNPDPDRPQFLFLHYSDPHGPYTPPAPYDTLYDSGYQGEVTGYNNDWTDPSKLSAEDIEHVKALYDGEISYMDNKLQRALAMLRGNDLLEDSIVVFVGDHGQALSQHGYWGHGLPYDHNVHIPLFIRFPKMESFQESVDQQVRTIDVAPTLLDYLDIKIPDQFMGQSLLPLMKGEDTSYDGGIYFERPASSNGHHMYGYTTRDFKYIYHRTPSDTYEELFDLRDDPGETDNIINERPGLAEDLRERIPFDPGSVEPDRGEYSIQGQVERDALKGLGYVN